MSAAAVFLFAACEKVEAPDPGKPDDGGEGNDPVEETGFIPGTILAQYNETSVTLRQGTDESETLSYYFETDDEVTEERTVTLKVDETLVGDSRLLPEANSRRHSLCLPALTSQPCRPSHSRQMVWRRVNMSCR